MYKCRKNMTACKFNCSSFKTKLITNSCENEPTALYKTSNDIVVVLFMYLKTNEKATHTHTVQ